LRVTSQQSSSSGGSTTTTTASSTTTTNIAVFIGTEITQERGITVYLDQATFVNLINLLLFLTALKICNFAMIHS